MEKLLPQNSEAEAGTIGSLLIDPEGLPLVSDWLASDDFYREAHRAIYQAMVDLYQNRTPADLITLTDELARRGKLEDCGGLSYISSLANQVPTSANLEYYGRIVDRCARLRRLIHAAGQIAAVAYNEPEAEDAETQAMNLLFKATTRKDRGGFVNFGTVLDETARDIHRRMEAEHGTGVMTGIRGIDKHLLGFEPGEMILVLGRPSNMKSVMGAMIALNHAETMERTLGGAPGSVAWITLEMGRMQQARRLLAAVGEVNTKRMRSGFRTASGEYDDDAFNRYQAAWTDMRERLDTRIRIMDGTGSLSEINARLAQEVRSQGCQIAIIDQLDLIEGDEEHKNEKEFDRIGRYSRQLKLMSGSLNIPIVVLAQLNRATEQNVGGRPTLANIANSDRLGRDCDIAIATHLPSALQENKARALADAKFREYGEALFLKARDNERDVFAPFRAQREFTRITDWPESWPTYAE
jgi:replicative DNA helicase